MKHYDLIVAGGGITGTAAAISAAREGLSVLLIERTGSLGGAFSNQLVYPFIRRTIVLPDGSRTPINLGLYAEMAQRHKEMGGVSASGWQPEIFKITLDQMLTEAGAEVLFHTQLIDVSREGRLIKTIRVAGKSGIFELGADFFIDTTGDGDLMAYAGCAYQLGRESDGLCQPMTTCFRMSGVDLKKFREEHTHLIQLYQEAQERGEIENPRENILVFYGLSDHTLHLNTTRVVKHNPVDVWELSQAEIIARRQVLEMYHFLRKHSEACKNAVISSIASEVGVRESRKLKGVYILTGEDLKACTDFEDSIAVGNYDIDIHNPEGSGTYMYRLAPSEYYRIPYRCLLPRETDNLWVAGRCLSADHAAHSAVRVIPIVACMGEAAGCAAALAHQTGTNAHTLDVPALQSMLVRKGAKIH